MSEELNFKLVKDPVTGETNSVLRKNDSACIPMSANNKDYQEYLEWVAAGNTAEAAD